MTDDTNHRELRNLIVRCERAHCRLDATLLSDEVPEDVHRLAENLILPALNEAVEYLLRLHEQKAQRGGGR